MSIKFKITKFKIIVICFFSNIFVSTINNFNFCTSFYFLSGTSPTVLRPSREITSGVPSGPPAQVLRPWTSGRRLCLLVPGGLTSDMVATSPYPLCSKHLIRKTVLHKPTSIPFKKVFRTFLILVPYNKYKSLFTLFPKISPGITFQEVEILLKK